MAEKNEAVLPVKIDTTQAFAELEQLNQGLTAAVSNMLGSTLNEYSNAGAAIEASIEKTALRISGLEVKLADNLTANKDVIKSEIKTLPNIIHKNKLKMDHRPKCKARHNKPLRGKHRQKTI